MKKFKQHIVFALQLVDFGILIFFENQSIKLNLATHFIALMRKENGKIDESTFEHVFDTRRTNSFSNGKFQTGHTTKYLNANISMIQYISAEMQLKCWFLNVKKVFVFPIFAWSNYRTTSYFCHA